MIRLKFRKEYLEIARKEQSPTGRVQSPNSSLFVLFVQSIQPALKMTNNSLLLHCVKNCECVKYNGQSNKNMCFSIGLQNIMW